MNYFEYKELKSKQKNNRLFNESKIKKAFTERLKRKGFSTAIFEDNCKTLNVIACRRFPYNEAATYDLLFNNLLVNKKDYIDFIWHELLHVSSTRKTDEAIYSGLYVTNQNCEPMGRGLNEGVTVLLEEMLFKGITKGHDEKNDGYKLEKFLCRILYDILGDFLFECYFTADFHSFYNYLVKFNGLEETNEFIQAFDTICLKSFYLVDSENPDIKSIVDSYNFAIFYLLELCIKHIVKNYESGYINEQTYKDGIKGCLDYFSEIHIKDKNERDYNIDKAEIRRIIEKNIPKY